MIIKSIKIVALLGATALVTACGGSVEVKGNAQSELKKFFLEENASAKTYAGVVNGTAVAGTQSGTDLSGVDLSGTPSSGGTTTFAKDGTITSVDANGKSVISGGKWWKNGDNIHVMLNVDLDLDGKQEPYQFTLPYSTVKSYASGYADGTISVDSKAWSQAQVKAIDFNFDTVKSHLSNESFYITNTGTGIANLTTNAPSISGLTGGSVTGQTALTNVINNFASAHNLGWKGQGTELTSITGNIASQALTQNTAFLATTSANTAATAEIQKYVNLHMVNVDGSKRDQAIEHVVTKDGTGLTALSAELKAKSNHASTPVAGTAATDYNVAGDGYIAISLKDARGFSMGLSSDTFAGLNSVSANAAEVDAAYRAGSASIVWSKFNNLKGTQIMDLMYATADQTTKVFDLSKALSPVGNLN